QTGRHDLVENCPTKRTSFDLCDFTYALNPAEGSAIIIAGQAAPEMQRLSMERVPPIAATALLFSCVTALAAPPSYSLSDHPSQDGRCIGDNGAGDLDRSEQICLKQVGKLARRTGPELQLKFRNGLVLLSQEVAGTDR
ncbi:MAG TPA: hypothetical protein VGJ20_00455, partial [Xanthobacteraceae bacterium]